MIYLDTCLLAFHRGETMHRRKETKPGAKVVNLWDLWQQFRHNLKAYTVVLSLTMIEIFFNISLSRKQHKRVMEMR